MSDEERESRIKAEAHEMEDAMACYAQSGCLLDRADADSARLRMEALIAGRSPEAVARAMLEAGQ